MLIPIDCPVLPVFSNQPPLFTREDCLALQKALNVSTEQQMGEGVEREDDVPVER